MKKILFRKLLADYIKFFLLALVSTSVIIWVFQAVNYLDIMIEDGRDYLVYINFSLLNFPKTISKIYPFILFFSLFYITVKYELNNELIIYSYQVAGTVGLMMAKILNVKSKDSLRSAIDLGIAMQLTNIARDVIEDSNRNRKYINLDFDTIRETLKLADIFYESSFKSINKIPLNCRFAIIVARRVYRQIGNEILKRKNIENYKNSGKIYVSNLGKLNQTILSILDFIRLLFIKSDEHLRKNEHNIINDKINLDERF